MILVPKCRCDIQIEARDCGAAIRFVSLNSIRQLIMDFKCQWSASGAKQKPLIVVCLSASQCLGLLRWQ